MKKILNIILAVFFVWGFFSCNDYDEDYFEKTSAERIKETVSEYKKILLSSEKGWVMEYFPGGSDQKYGGFTYILKFTETEVTARLCGNTSDPITSSYNVIPNGGATLSFDSYNKLLHQYSKPFNLKPTGSEGDFEFLLVSHTEDEVIMKGKKYGNRIRLFKLKESEEEFIARMDKVEKQVVDKGLFLLKINDQETEFSIDNGILTFFYNENGEEKTTKGSFILTTRGLSFYNPVKIAGVEFQKLLLNEEGVRLQSADKKVVFYIPYEVPFDLTETVWTTKADDATLCSLAFTKEWEKLRDSSADEFGYVKPTIRFGKIGWTFSSSGNTYYAEGVEFMAENKKWNRRYYVPNKKLTFFGTLNKGELGFRVGGGWQDWFVNSHLDPFVTYLAENMPYKVEKNDEKNPTEVKLISTKDPNIWFVLKK